MSNNPNLPVVRRKATELGAVVVEVREGAKHTVVTIQTCDRRQVQMTLSRYRIDPYILEGWTRQALTRAVASTASRLNRFGTAKEIIGRVANDNEIL